MKVIPGTIQSCSRLLKEGNYLAIAPGGVYEAQFSVNYNLMWKKRLGFAKVAIDSKVVDLKSTCNYFDSHFYLFQPVIPVFSENLCEAFRTLHIGRRIFLKLYMWTRFPCAPIYGGFPVKMITHIGKPIYYEPGITPEDLQIKVFCFRYLFFYFCVNYLKLQVASSLEDLILKHQRLPGNILFSILERVPAFRGIKKQSHHNDQLIYLV